MAKTRKAGKKKRCGICNGSGVVPSRVTAPARQGEDGRKIEFRPPMERCECNGGVPQPASLSAKSLNRSTRDWASLAAGDGSNP